MTQHSAIPAAARPRARKHPATQLFHPTFTELLLLCLSTLTLVQSLGEPLQANQPTGDEPAGAALAGQHRQRIEHRAGRALGLVRDWALRLGHEIHQVTQEATCHRTLRSQFDPAKGDRAKRGPYRASVVSVDWTRQHADIVNAISTSMIWHENAVRSIVEMSEQLSANHTYDENLPNVEYVDVHRLIDQDEPAEEGAEQDAALPPTEPEQGSGAPADSSPTPPATDAVSLEPDQLMSDSHLSGDGQSRFRRHGPKLGQSQPEQLVGPQALVMQPAGTPMPEDAQGEWQTPMLRLPLARHPNFGDTPVSTEDSAVHVPVHIYPGQPAVKNAIAWSASLTSVFKNNLVQNPRLTNQYFASPHGFMRLFPAQKWPIPRSDPDLYDARMRPWYVAGATSRKDVVILVDASGSMTGSRRDIAKGVVFEILDTLTHNDHFVVLRFNDFVHQVGVPACRAMRLERRRPNIPLKNTVRHSSSAAAAGLGAAAAAAPGAEGPRSAADNNGTDIDSLYLLPATGRNVRQLKTNFTIPTSGIANFSHALVTAFDVLQKYEASDTLGSRCNQAIMLITDGSPSDFSDIFDRYNVPNKPVRVFTYLIGRETGDGSHTKMMACHNKGFYTHVINLAEVRETVQQYISVMARPLVLNRTHPTTWTPAYGELTYQMLTDWIWESRRRERARNMLANRTTGGTFEVKDYALEAAGPDDDEQAAAAELPGSPEDDLERFDLFGYETNPDCFWETHRNDLTTTVVQPVYDQHNESTVVEKFLNKNQWVRKASRMRTANLLGVAAADMKINDMLRPAASHRLGANGYPALLTNNGIVMHHPDLRSILEPMSSEASERNSRILKPFFSSLDLVELEHVLARPGAAAANDSALGAMPTGDFLALRNEAVDGKTGWRELLTKRTLDCQRRVQTRVQSFYYKPLARCPFVLIVAIPQPYGSHRLEAQVEVKSPELPERLTTYFTTSDYDLWTAHPDFRYCEGPSNNTITTLLDVFQRIEKGKLTDIEWHPTESRKPAVPLPGKIYCDKELVQSLVYDAVATYSFLEDCGPAAARDDEPSLMSTFGVRFSFVATRSGLTRVRHHNADDQTVKLEALAFAKRHARAMDETFYKRTVDYNMLMNETATLLQVPFNTHRKIADLLNSYETGTTAGGASGEYPPADGTSETGPLGTKLSIKDMDLFEKLEVLANKSLHVIATESLVVNEGAQRAVAGVAGVFYDYATFVLRFMNSTGARFAAAADDLPKKPAKCFLGDHQDQELCGEESAGAHVKCGHLNDTIDCLLVDNNGYILVSERLDFVGRNLRAYEPAIMQRLVANGLFHEVNITDHQSICVKQEEKQGAQAAASSAARLSLGPFRQAACSLLTNLAASLVHAGTLALEAAGFFLDLGQTALAQRLGGQNPSSSLLALESQQQQSFQLVAAQLPKKSYLRPCDRVLIRYETRPGPAAAPAADKPEHFSGRCNCPGWFVYEQVPATNLIMLVVDSAPVACPNSKCADGPRPADDDSLMTQSNILGQDEAQTCSMFERDLKLHKREVDVCISRHPGEENIELCGAAGLPAALLVSPTTSFLWSFSLFCVHRLMFGL